MDKMAAGTQGLVVRGFSSQLSSLLPRPSPLAAQRPPHWVRAKGSILTIRSAVSRLTKGCQLGPVVMEVGGDFVSRPLTLGVTPSVSEARGLESGGYALPHLATASPVCGDYSTPLPDTLRSCRSTGLTMPSCLPQI